MLTKYLYRLLAVTLSILAMSGAFAVERHELRTDPQLLGQLQKATGVANQHAAFGLTHGEKLELLRTNVGPNGISHSRYRQTIGGVPVWGEQIVISRDPSGKVLRLHGRLIKGLASELFYFTPALKSEEALNFMKDRTRKGVLDDDTLFFENESVELVVYLDGTLPVLSYAVSFFADTAVGGQPTRPTYLIDASSGVVLFEYEGLTHANGIGPGGNGKTGQYEYGTDFGYLDVSQSGITCTMDNANVKTVNLNHSTSGSTAYSYSPCLRNTHKEINGAFSPLNDAHYFGGVVYDMYNAWVGAPPLTFQLMMRVHYSNNYENAFWNGSSMTFGDGYTTFYPLVGLDVAAHEVSHGFTEQHSDLNYFGQSGGINEAFSDMAGEAAEYYAWGTNDFKVGAEIYKVSGAALRYMEDPTLDGRSIGRVEDYYYGLDVHYSSGVYNKAFHTLATTCGWGTQSAFRVFAHANEMYWTPSTSFRSGAFAVVDAVADLYNAPNQPLVFSSCSSTDLDYPEPQTAAEAAADVEAAFLAVGINLGPVCGSVTPLASGQSETISGDEGSWTCFETVVSTDTNSFTVTLTEEARRGRWKTAAGDPDLYVREVLIPDPDNPETAIEVEEEGYDCRSISSGGNESCVISSPAAGNWYTGVYGWSAYNKIRVEVLLEGGSEPPPPPTAEITLTATSGGNGKFVRLNWSGATATTVDIYRNNLDLGTHIDTTPNDGSYKDNGGGSGNGNLYQVCQEDRTVCSASVPVP